MDETERRFGKKRGMQKAEPPQKEEIRG